MEGGAGSLPSPRSKGGVLDPRGGSGLVTGFFAGFSKGVSECSTRFSFMLPKPSFAQHMLSHAHHSLRVRLPRARQRPASWPSVPSRQPAAPPGDALTSTGGCMKLSQTGGGMGSGGARDSKGRATGHDSRKYREKGRSQNILTTDNLGTADHTLSRLASSQAGFRWYSAASRRNRSLIGVPASPGE